MVYKPTLNKAPHNPILSDDDAETGKNILKALRVLNPHLKDAEVFRDKAGNLFNDAERVFMELRNGGSLNGAQLESVERLKDHCERHYTKHVNYCDEMIVSTLYDIDAM